MAPPLDEEERAASSIPCKDFNSGEDELPEWLDIFELAVRRATNATTTERLEYLYGEWLCLKLDQRASNMLALCVKTQWSDLKKELANLLVDPNESYRWRAGMTKITWDQKETLDDLAHRVKKKVNKYESHRGVAGKEESYFMKFRQALPAAYRTAIDMGCEEGNRKIDQAREIAARWQLSHVDEEARKANLTGATFESATIDEKMEKLSIAKSDIHEASRATDGEKCDERYSESSSDEDRSPARGEIRDSRSGGGNREREEDRYQDCSSGYNRDAGSNGRHGKNCDKRYSGSSSDEDRAPARGERRYSRNGGGDRDWEQDRYQDSPRWYDRYAERNDRYDHSSSCRTGPGYGGDRDRRYRGDRYDGDRGERYGDRRERDGGYSYGSRRNDGDSRRGEYEQDWDYRPSSGRNGGGNGRDGEDRRGYR